MREQYIKEGYRSLAIGNFITLLIFSHTHNLFTSPVDVVAFWIGLCLVATYAVWTVIILTQKSRDA